MSMHFRFKNAKFLTFLCIFQRGREKLALVSCICSQIVLKWGYLWFWSFYESSKTNFDAWRGLHRAFIACSGRLCSVRRFSCGGHSSHPIFDPSVGRRASFRRRGDLLGKAPSLFPSPFGALSCRNGVLDLRLCLYGQDHDHGRDGSFRLGDDPFVFIPSRLPSLSSRLSPSWQKNRFGTWKRE